jgi:PIN domain nuclease of toxin-antitoxin system
MSGTAPDSVLDASALIALLWEETGGSAVEPLLHRTVISAVNWVEVLQHYEADGVSIRGKRQEVETIGIAVVEFTADDAATVVRLRAPTRKLGLSLADRACLALALRFGVAAHTADRAWADLDVGPTIVLIR